MTKEKINNKYHRFIESLYFAITRKQSKVLVCCLAIALLGLISLYKVTHINHAEKATSIDKVYAEWQNDLKSKGKYKSLIGLMNKNPSLGRFLEPLVIQRLIYQNDPNFKKLASAFLSKGGFASLYHTEYSNISMLVSEGKIEEALKRSLELKTKMEKEGRDNLEVYPYNLFRICILSKKLEDPKKEVKGWDDLENYLKRKENSFSLNIEKINHFKLDDYILQRRRIIEKSSKSNL